MATIKFRLHSKKGNTSIYLQLSIGRGNYFQRKTGLNINVKDWSKATGLPKQNDETNKNLTTDLRDLATFVLKKLNDAEKNGDEVTGDWLSYNIDLNFDRIKEDKQSNLLGDYIQKIIDNADTKVLQGGKMGLSKNRVKGYITFKGIIEKYQTHIKKKINFKDIDINFEEDFKNWLIRTKGFSVNYAGKNFDNLKAVCNDAIRKGKVVNNHAIHLKSFIGDKEAVDVITLSFEELEQIEKLNNLTPHIENTRKWLLLGCEIGQRGGDLLNITEKNFETSEGVKFINVKQQKTGNDVAIGVNEKIEKILVTGLPYKISIQRFNDYLKDLCELADINIMAKGRLYNPEKKRKIEDEYPKYKLITSHTCRRSFATNYYKYIPTPVLMEVTGHSKESLFLTYIRKKKDKYENAKLFLKLVKIMEEERKERKEKEKRNRKAKLKVIKTAN